VVKQRLRLASVSPRLHEVYAEDGMTLEQLIAFSVNEDHARQEQVWELLAHSWNKAPVFIRQKLTEDTIHAGDRRALFVGVDAYIAAGGAVMRDLFEDDRGGWLSDPALLDQLVAEKLKAEGERIQAEGWAWVVTSVSLPYGFDDGLRELDAVEPPLTEEQQTRVEALTAEEEALELEHEGADELPEAVETRLQEIGRELAALDDRPWAYDPMAMARAGAFVSFGSDGSLQVDRGFVRPEDEPAEEPDPEAGAGDDADSSDFAGADGAAIPAAVEGTAITAVGAIADEEEDNILKPLPDRLVTELTAQRTVALQDAFAQNPKVAFAAVLHALTLSAFYPSGQESCLTLSVSRLIFFHQPTDMRESPSAKAIAARHASWREHLPKSDKDLWTALQALDSDEQAALFAHCAALAVNAVWEAVPRYDGRISALTIQRRVAHADVLAAAVGLDMAKAGWRPTVANFLGRVTKAHILKAVNEGKDAEAAGRIDHLRKDDMAKEAERLLADVEWLPEPLRTPVSIAVEADSEELASIHPTDVEREPLAKDQEAETAAFVHAAE
jgi:ParB family transcriptional regulator, chromosome partitioning protein